MRFVGLHEPSLGWCVGGLGWCVSLASLAVARGGGATRLRLAASFGAILSRIGVGGGPTRSREVDVG